MGVAIVVGTKKGCVVLRSDERRERFEVGDMVFRGWEVTAATHDAGGRTYLGVTNEVYGPAIAVSDDLENWRTIDKSPRYAPDLPGNPAHQQIAGLQPGPRRVDSIWRHGRARQRRQVHL